MGRLAAAYRRLGAAWRLRGLSEPGATWRLIGLSAPQAAYWRLGPLTCLSAHRGRLAAYRLIGASGPLSGLSAYRHLGPFIGAWGRLAVYRFIGASGHLAPTPGPARVARSPIAGQFPAELGPGTALNGSDSKNGAECDHNQPRRPILRPAGGHLPVQTKKT